MKESINNYAKLGLNHHTFFPCKDDPEFHIQTLPRMLNRDDIEMVDLTIPYGSEYRKVAIDMVLRSGKDIVYNGYLMPTPKIPLSTISYTEKSQILLLAKDQVDVALACGASYFMQSVGADPGPEKRQRAFESLGEYIYELSEYMDKNGKLSFLIELMDRDITKKSLCGPVDEVLEFLDKLSVRVPNIGIVLDINHLILMQESFEYAFTACKRYLKHVHLGNCIFKDDKDPLWGGMHPPIGIDGGEIDIPQLVQILKILLHIGYLDKDKRSGLSLEIREFPGKSMEETALDNLERINKAWMLV